MQYWLCKGIGIEVGKLEPHLNVEKCLSLAKEQFADEDIPAADEISGLDELEELLWSGGLFDNLADMLTFCDDTDTLTWDSNGEGEYFFYYIPSYPWERVENEPQSLEEVHERIIAAVQRVCDISGKEIEEMIDNEIYEVGCG